MGFLIVIDQGTTSSGVSLVNDSGRIACETSVPVKSTFPRAGWVEQSAEEIWLGVETAIRKVCLEKALFTRDIVALGITNQRETVVAIDKVSGKALSPAIVWQCRRTEEFCRKNKKATWLTKLTGLPMDPYFSGSKMRWLLENSKEVQKARLEKRLAFVTMDAFLFRKLTGKLQTDVTNASRTQLMDLLTLKWSEKALKFFGIDNTELPEIGPSAGELGVVSELEALKGVPVYSMIGDQQSALYGHRCYRKGEGKLTLGTGSFLLVNTGSKPVMSRNGLASTVAWKIGSEKPLFALEGSAFACGAAIQWASKSMGLFSNTEEFNTLAGSVASSAGLVFVPALAGLGAPYWESRAKGAFLYMHLGHTRNHLARAIMEGLAWQNQDLVSAFEKDLGSPMKKIRVDGGVSASDLLLQIHSDFMRCRVERPSETEMTTIGAALLAGEVARFWDPERLIVPYEGPRPAKNSVEAKEFSPLAEVNLVEAHKARWRIAVKSVAEVSVALEDAGI